MNEPRCRKCHRPKYRTGNFYLPHSDILHIMWQREYRHTVLWYAVLAYTVYRTVRSR